MAGLPYRSAVRYRTRRYTYRGLPLEDFDQVGRRRCRVSGLVQTILTSGDGYACRASGLARTATLSAGGRRAVPHPGTVVGEATAVRRAAVQRLARTSAPSTAPARRIATASGFARTARASGLSRTVTTTGLVRSFHES